MNSGLFILLILTVLNVSLPYLDGPRKGSAFTRRPLFHWVVQHWKKHLCNFQDTKMAWLRYSDFELFVIDPFHVQEQNVGVISKAPLSPGHRKGLFNFYLFLGWKHEFQSQERNLENLVGRENQKSTLLQFVLSKSSMGRWSPVRRCQMGLNFLNNRAASLCIALAWSSSTGLVCNLL